MAGNGGTRGWMAWGFVAAVAALVLTLVWIYPEALSDRDDQIHLTQSLAILALVGSSLLLSRRFEPGSALKGIVVWAAIGFVVFGLYSFRGEFGALFDRMSAELLPHAPRVIGNDVVIRAGQHGHFVAEVKVDGNDVRFLVDTGARDVVLSPADAKRLGFDPESLRFSKFYRTANGIVRGAPVRLSEMSIGPIRVTDVRASVNEADMNRSLLGMSFLSRLSGYAVEGDKLILKP